MVTYMPILKGRQGELTAVEHLSPALRRQVLPIFEVDPTVRGPVEDAHRFVDSVCGSVLAGLVIAVEVRYLDGPVAGLRRPMRIIADDLNSWRISILPVLHLDDSSEQLADAGHAAEIHRGTAVLRLAIDAHDPDGEEADKALARLHDQTGLPTDQCHLLLDLIEMRSERDLTRAEPAVRKWMSWAQRYPWRSITVAAGAMPASISHIPFMTPTALPRWDFQLWQRVAGLGVQYADYGTAHPAMTGAKWRPKPNLRYTDDENWWIYRWSEEKTGSHPMYDLCQALVASDYWPASSADLSWGDQQIAARAHDLGGPGNPGNWRAWSTSHHLAHVAAQLSRPGPTEAGRRQA